MRIPFLTLLGAAVILGSCARTPDKVFAVSPASGIDGFYAPWDNLSDNTVFRCFSDTDNFYFFYEVTDSTITCVPEFSCESDVENEDRVEIFFSPTEDMEIYYCAEIDPLGRVLDYSSRYYRDMDYSWDFETLNLFGKLTETGYIVAGKISRAELRTLNVDLEGGFYMGVFRADYRPDLSVNWYSSVSTDDKSPDFHKPDVLFRAKLISAR